LIKTILVPLDGSPLAEQILRLVRPLARRTEAHIVLVAAVVPTHTWLGAEEPRDEESASAGAALESIRQSLNAEGLKASVKVMSGKAADCIRDAATSEGADIIAMTSHGRSGLPRLVTGSVTDEVIRTAPEPVLVLRASDLEPDDLEINEILVALDGSPLSESIIPVVEGMAQQLGASILLVRAVTPSTLLFLSEFIPSSPPALDEIEAKAKRYLEGIAKKIRQSGIKVKTDVATDYAAEAIIDVATRKSVDLIAIGTHARSVAGRLVMGSTADNVARHSPKPCLLIRPVEVAAPEGEQREGVVEIVPGVEEAAIVIPPPDWPESEDPAPQR